MPAPFHLSMRFTLAVTLALMSTLALVLALTTGEFYHRLALDNQRDALAELAQITARGQLHELEERARDLGLALQADSGFRAAVARGDRAALARELRNQFNQYFVTANVIKLAKLEAYDRTLQPLASATAAEASTRPVPGCPQLIEQAGARTGHARLQILSTLCVADAQPRFAILVPIGGLVPTGYLEVMTDPTPALAQTEQRLGVAVRLRTADGGRLYASDHWPPPDAMQSTLVGEHILRTAQGDAVLGVALLRDVAPLHDRLRQTRYLVMGLAFAVTVLAVVLALIMLEKTTLRPLAVLTERLRRFGQTRELTGESLPVRGIAEVRELTQEFNLMARELGRLYGSLEHMAFTDPLTQLPNRARFHDSLAESTRRHARTQTPFALLLMDLDRFKFVNDTLGHLAGDLLLQEVSARLKSVLRESDTITRLVGNNAGVPEEKMVARLGGDEFAVILPGVTTLDAAGSIARKLLSVVQIPFHIRGHDLAIGMSIGIALYPQHGEDIDILMQRADSAMYAAKNSQSGFAFAETMQQAELL